jgi:prepilin-type N-terminal cleavage/methylation domain-containing protein
MNKFSVRRVYLRYASFTLVELLVVIAIIAILAAVTMQIGITVINEAKKTKAQNTAIQIQTAVLNYYTEYSLYPTPSGISVTTDYELTDADAANGGVSIANSWGPLIDCLSGNLSPSGGTPSTEFGNTRSVAFLTLRATDVTTAGAHQDAPLNPLPNNAAKPYFNIAFDTAYAGILGKGDTGLSTAWLPNFTTVTSGTAPPMTGTSTAGVAVWAYCNPSVTNSNWDVRTY